MIWINNSVNDFFVSDTTQEKLKTTQETTQEKIVELLKATLMIL